VSTSLYDHVRAHLDPDGPGLLAGGDRLPDEDRSGDAIAWAPGARLTSQWVDLDGDSSELSLKLEPKTLGHTNKQGHAYGSYE